MVDASDQNKDQSVNFWANDDQTNDQPELLNDTSQNHINIVDKDHSQTINTAQLENITSHFDKV